MTFEVHVTSREGARAEVQAVEAETPVLVRELAKDGVPTRDIATLTGVSFQRASQLVNC